MDRLARYGRVFRWYESAFVRQLADNADSLQRQHITERSLLNQITSSAPRPWAKEVDKEARRQFQKTAHHDIMAATIHSAEERVRSTLARFGVKDRRQADRSL